MSNVTEKNSPASGPIEEPQLNEYLSGGSSYSRLYREVEADDVPLMLDHAVLSEAQAAVAKRKGMNWQRAVPTLAIAATAVLTISIVLRSGLESSRSPEQQLRDEFAAAVADKATANAEAEQKPDAGATADVVRIIEPKVTPVEPPKISILEEPAPAVRMQAPAAAAPATPAPEHYAEKKKLEKDSGVTAESRADASAPILALQKEAVVSGGFVRQTPQELALPVEVITNEQLANAKPAGVQASQPAASRSAAPPVKAHDASAALEEALVTGQLRAKAAPGAGPRGTVAIQTQSSADRRAERESREANPEFWLTYIRELRADNKGSAADREWERFVKAFPNYVVAADDSARPKK